MTDILKADIFFFVTSIGVGLVTLALLVAIYFFVKIVKEIRDIISAVRAELAFFKDKRREIEIRLRTFERMLSSFGSLFRRPQTFEEL